MTVEAQGSISLLYTQVADLFASIEAFRDWTDTSDLQEALEHIYFSEGPPEEDEFDAMPFLVFRSGDGDVPTYRHVAGGDRHVFVREGELLIWAVDRVRDLTLSARDRFLEFANPLGSIIDALNGLSGYSNLAAIQNITVLMGPQLSDETKPTPYWQALLRVQMSPN